jgi:tRNA G37 N-methylase Trm5
LPTEQLNLFNQGKEQLEKCVKSDLWNTEIRFIRLTLQCQSPWFLGYHDEIEEDAKIVIDHVHLGYVQKQNTYWKKALEFIKMQDKVPASLKKTI